MQPAATASAMGGNMKRHAWVWLAAACIEGWSTLASADALLPYSIALQNFGTTPQTTAFTFAGPYSGGPYSAVAANFNAVLTDTAGDGATLGFSVANSVNGSAIPALDTSGTCSVAAGPALGASTCIGGGGGVSASAPVDVGDGALISDHVLFTLSQGDAFALVSFSLFSGPSAPQLVGGAISAQNVSNAPTLFDITISALSTGRHTEADTVFIGVLMDLMGDGASVSFTNETKVGANVVSALTLSGSCAFDADALAIGSCPANVALAAGVAGFAASATGTFQTELELTLSPGDAAALTGGLRLFNANAVPEPGTLLLVGCALATLAWRRRRR